MIRLGGLVIVMVALGQAGMAQASAWTLPRGKGQVIVKYEAMLADRGFDPTGHSQSLGVQRQDQSLSALLEYGLSDRLTLQAKTDWQSGEDAYVDFEGRGPIEVGARWQVYRGIQSVVSVYGGYAKGGEGRNAGYAPPGQGDQDWELRFLAGRSGPAYFVDAQVARRWRDGLPDEVRSDLTVGVHVSPQWTLMAQAYGGQTDEDSRGERAAWLALEAGAVRHFGDWSAQMAWRQTVWGRETPEAGGPVVAIWRRF